MNNQKKQINLEVGQIYKIDGKGYIVDEKTHNKIYGYLVDEENEPYGRRRILGTKGKEIIKVELS